MVVSQSEFDNHQCLRDQRRVSASNLENVLIQFFNRGEIFGEADGRSFDVKQGSIAMFDLEKKYEFQSLSKTNCINMVIPKYMLDAKIMDFSHGNILLYDTSIAKIVSSHMINIWDVLPNIGGSEIHAMQQMTVDLLNSGFGFLLGVDKNKEYAVKEKISSYIFDNCQDNISIDFLANKFHVSRATLFRIFSAEGGVACFVKNARLRKCFGDVFFSKNDFSNAEMAKKWGFSNEQQFVRLFKKKYNLTPYQIREAKLNNDCFFEIKNFYKFLESKSLPDINI